MRNMEVSKRILLGSWAATILLTGLVVWGTFICLDVSYLTTLAGLAWGELTAAHGFYYWKAKNENRAKGAQQLVRDLADQYGIEQAARFAEIVFRD